MSDAGRRRKNCVKYMPPQPLDAVVYVCSPSFQMVPAMRVCMLDIFSRYLGSRV